MCTVLITVISIGVCSFITYIINLIRRQRRMIKLLRERNNKLFLLNVDASKKIVELKRLLTENMNHLASLSELIAVNSKSCKSERFYKECLKRFSINSHIFILNNITQVVNSLFNNAIDNFLMDRRKLSKKEIIVCCLILLNFSTSSIHILCEYKDSSCVYTLAKRLKKKLCLNDFKGTLKQYLKSYANDY